MGEYNSLYDVHEAALEVLGGDMTRTYSTLYDVDLAVLGALEDLPTGGLEPVVVVELPTTGEAGKMYFVPNPSAAGQDNYKEYLWVNNAWECVGNADVDLSEYVTKTDAKSFINLAASHIPSGVDTITFNGAGFSCNSSGSLFCSTLTKTALDSMTESCVISKGTMNNVLADYSKTADVYSKADGVTVSANLVSIQSSDNVYTQLNNGGLHIENDGCTFNVDCYEDIVVAQINGEDIATQTWVGDSFAKVRTLTQAQYDALTTKDAKTLYIISDAD